MTKPLRIGLLRLADSAPVIIAHNHGLFAKHGVETEIIISPSWANIADGLTWNTLDAAVVFPPLAMMTALGRRGHAAPLHALSTISRGGNTIILRGDNPLDTLWPAGADGRKAFDEWRTSLGRVPRIAVVHMYSTHLLILRRFLMMIQVDMDTEIELIVMPPADMISALEEGSIDGGCVGPSWGTEACMRGLTFLVGGSSTVRPNHLEKLFVISDRILSRANTAQQLEMALQEAVRFCQMPENRTTIARELELPAVEGGLALPQRATIASLTGQATTDLLTFDEEKIQLSDIEWILGDMMELNWISGQESRMLEEWISPMPVMP